MKAAFFRRKGVRVRVSKRKVKGSKYRMAIQLNGGDYVVAFSSPSRCVLSFVFSATLFPWDSRSVVPTNNFPPRRGRTHPDAALSAPSTRGCIQCPLAKRLLETYLLSRLMGLRASRKLLQFFTRLSLRNSIRFPDCSTCSKFVARRTLSQLPSLSVEPSFRFAFSLAFCTNVRGEASRHSDANYFRRNLGSRLRAILAKPKIQPRKRRRTFIKLPRVCTVRGLHARAHPAP